MIQTHIVSERPAERWEDAMVSGNGSTGIMVMGRPLDETIIINHEKLWVVKCSSAPETPDLSGVWMEARDLAFQGRYRDAHEHFQRRRKALMQPILEKHGMKSGRLPYDHIHPGLYLHIDMDSCGRIRDYQRQTQMDTGEVSVSWTDTAGHWERKAFVSRTDDVIVMDVAAPKGEVLTCRLYLAESPGKGADEIGDIRIQYDHNEMLYHASYARTMGQAKPEGYQLLARVISHGGSLRCIADDCLTLSQTERVLVVMRLVYLDDATVSDVESVRAELNALPADYRELLNRHAEVHGEMFNRVTLDLGSPPGEMASTEALLNQTREMGPSARLLETLHAIGRYAWICGGTGELPVALSGIWGNDWQPPWDGRYTFDANINLAISGVSQGALTEAMDTYCGYIEASLEDWRYNARQLFGCRGILPDLCQGWRHGKSLMHYPWVGGAGWLASYLYDHYRYTKDQTFLRARVLPIMEEVARFYEDFLENTEGEDGRVRFYPSVSPENFPIMADSDQVSSVVPNATCEIAICREALENVVEAYGILDIDSDELTRWRALLAKLPDYVINQDGALAEWAYPGMGDRYAHRHSSQLYPLWPSLEFSPERNAVLFRAARIAVEKRIQAGLGNKSAHGFMHLLLVAARLRDADLLWHLLDDFSRWDFFNASMISCHNPGLMIYNLDTTFTMPSVLTKMLLHSAKGALELLPALPGDHLASGTVTGLHARGGITVEELHWNILCRRMTLQLRSDREQTVVLDSPFKLRGVQAGPGCADAVELSGGDRTPWTVVLPAETSVRLYCSI